MPSDADLIADLNTLNQIAETLNRASDVQGALDNALARLVELMEMETGWIFVVDPAAQERWAGRGYRLAAHHNLPPALAVTNPAAWDKECDCGALCRDGKLNAAYNEVRCSRIHEVPGDYRGLKIHASTPLRSGEQVLGILNIAAGDWASFGPRALALLTNVGNHIGIALERARLFDLLHERRVHEQAVLLDLSNQLLSRSNLDDVTTLIVNEVRKLLHVDACALLLPDEDPAFLRCRAAAGWHSDPVAGEFRISGGNESAIGQVMATQKPLWSEDGSSLYSFPEVQAWRGEEGFQGSAIVPLLADGVSIGALAIDVRGPRRFELSEIRLLQLMANQAAMAIETARLTQEEIRRQRIEEELNVGRQIQLSMLPHQCPAAPGWEISFAYETAQQVGGDFYDFFELRDEPDYLGILVADVSGKGVPAALFMALSRTTIRNTAQREQSPVAALLEANELIKETGTASMFLTAFYAKLHLQSGQVVYANAGHNRPLWWESATGQIRQLQARGIILGMLDDIELEEREILVAPGDVIVLYTDGVTEATNEGYEEYGESRLCHVIQQTMAHAGASAQELIDAIQRDVQEFTAGTPASDDLTLVVMRRE